MNDLIERSEVLKQLRLNHKDVVYIDKKECARRIESIPSARPQGEWIFRGDGKAICSDCGKSYDWDSEAQYYNYCPECGARMKGADDD